MPHLISQLNYIFLQVSSFNHTLKFFIFSASFFMHFHILTGSFFVLISLTTIDRLRYKHLPLAPFPSLHSLPVLLFLQSQETFWQDSNTFTDLKRRFISMLFAAANTSLHYSIPPARTAQLNGTSHLELDSQFIVRNV